MIDTCAYLPIFHVDLYLETVHIPYPQAVHTYGNVL